MKSLTLCVSSSGCWFIAFYNLCSKWVIQWVTGFRSSVSYSNKLTELKRESWEPLIYSRLIRKWLTSSVRRCRWNLQFVAGWSEAHVTTWACDWCLQWRILLWSWLPYPWNLILFLGRQYQTESNSPTPCFPLGSAVKKSVCSTGDPGLIPGLDRSLGEGNGYPLQCSCLENSMDRGASWATVHGVTESQTRLSDSHAQYQIELNSPIPGYFLRTAFWCGKPRHTHTHTQTHSFSGTGFRNPI